MVLALTAPEPADSASSNDAPVFLVTLEPRLRGFFENVGVLLRRSHTTLDLTSAPGEFWDDVFVPSPLPKRGLLRSSIVHVLAICALYAISLSPLFQKPVSLRSGFENTKIAYYPTSDYLPPIESSGKRARLVLKGEPAYAKQEIISVPPEPDNSRQTIITSNPARIAHDIDLPNVVINTPVLAAQAVAPRSLAELRVPKLPVDVVPPAPDDLPFNPRALQLPSDVVAPAPDPIASKRRLPQLPNEAVGPIADPVASTRRLPQFAPDVVAPAPDPVASSRRIIAIQSSAVEPPPSADEIKRRAGQLNMARLAPQAAEPRLPVAAQRATGAAGNGSNGGNGTSGGNATASGTAAAQPVPAAPSLQGLGGSRAAGQLIALSVQPSAPKGPIEVPSGSRRGVFAAGPDGKPGAPGTPNFVGGGADAGSGGNSDAGKGKGSGTAGNLEGITVGKPPAGAQPSVAASAPSTSPPAHPDPNVREKLLAAMRPSAAPSIERRTSSPAPPTGDHKIEDKVFGSKRYYQLTINMPNLSSAAGSWIIRFAELNQSRDATDLSAPVALSKSDPAYPPDLIRDKVEGTVFLYAVIRADGSVTDMRVISGVDERLNENAMKALARWHFQPGTKHGQPIDLEAVVQVPFRARRLPF